MPPEYDKPATGVIEVGPPQHNALRKTSMRQLLVICFSVGVFMIVTLPNHSDARAVGYWLIGVQIAIALLWCCWRFWLLIWHALDPLLDPLFETVSSPQVIAIRLEEEWGRPPTVVEVAAVHGMLISEHNQRMINSGLIIGAIFLLGHHEQ
jgi:hypothetical protein